MGEAVPSPAAPGHDFAAKKQNFYVGIALANEDLFVLHQQSGQMQRSEAFGVEETGRYKRWGNPTEHCLAEAAAGQVLADMIGLSPEDSQTLVQAALIHDWRKRGEIEETRGVTDPDVIEASYKKSEDELAAAGVPSKVVALTKTVAHTSLPDFADLQPDGSIKLKEDLPALALAMHYIDDITRGTDLVNLDERMQYLDDVAPERYPYNEEGRAVWGGRTFFQAQREIGHLVENRLAELAGVADPTSLPTVLMHGIIDQINQQGMAA